MYFIFMHIYYFIPTSWFEFMYTSTTRKHVNCDNKKEIINIQETIYIKF